MSCEYCGKKLKIHDEFILIGMYPTRGEMWKWSEAKNYLTPESYGKIYHKECYEKLQKSNPTCS